VAVGLVFAGAVGDAGAGVGVAVGSVVLPGAVGVAAGVGVAVAVGVAAGVTVAVGVGLGVLVATCAAGLLRMGSGSETLSQAGVSARTATGERASSQTLLNISNC
jgi:hypothetical protein